MSLSGGIQRSRYLLTFKSSKVNCLDALRFLLQIVFSLNLLAGSSIHFYWHPSTDIGGGFGFSLVGIPGASLRLYKSVYSVSMR